MTNNQWISAGNETKAHKYLREVMILLASSKKALIIRNNCGIALADGINCVCRFQEAKDLIEKWCDKSLVINKNGMSNGSINIAVENVNYMIKVQIYYDNSIIHLGI